MHADAEVRVPADTAYVAVVRMVTAGIAARLDFTLDDVEDLRMAVGEACALVLGEADPDGDLRTAFSLGEDRIDVEISADSSHGQPPDPTSFAWQVLTTAAADVRAAADDGRVTINLSLVRDPAGLTA